MGRPRLAAEPIVSTGMRLPKSLHERLLAAAYERDVAGNWLVCRAIEDFLDRLIPVDEIRWTRDPTQETP